jgi:hypothetical protein
LNALLASANLQRLNWLTVSGGGCNNEPELRLSSDQARAITELPHLAHLELGAQLDSQSRQILSNSPALAWPSLSPSGDDEQTWRAMRAPERTPPLDAALEDTFRGMAVIWQNRSVRR